MCSLKVWYLLQLRALSHQYIPSFSLKPHHTLPLLFLLNHLSKNSFAVWATSWSLLMLEFSTEVLTISTISPCAFPSL